ncbi:MAG TPA: O-antigen ligase family protein [Patescibacteria group bacterium]
MSWLVFFIYCLFPFGELIRIDAGNGLVIKPIDVLIVITSLLFISYNLLHKKFPKEPLVKPFHIFILFALVSLVVNVTWLSLNNFFVSLLYLVRFASIGILYVVIARFSKKQKSILSILMLISGFLVALFGFIQYVLYTNLINLSYLGWDNHWFRLFSTFFDPNFVGAFLVLYFLYVWYLAISHFIKKDTKKSIIFGLLSLLSLLAVFLTFSRSALLSLAVGITAVVFLQKKFRKIAAIALVCFGIGIGIILLNYQATEGTKLFRIASSAARITSAQDAIVIISKNPLLGIGFDAYRYAQLKFGTATGPNWQESHSGAGTDNSFLFVLATTGIIGFIFYINILVRIFMLCKKYLQKNSFAIVVISSLCAIIINSFFINSLFYPFILLWLVSLLGIIESNEQ